MKPISPHWADQAAAKVVRECGDKESYVVASGITPSGVVHIGNFREAITVDFVARALRSLGKKVRFIYSWDDFDTFRKVPKNFPEQEMLAKQMRKPICRVPDPFGEEKSYARRNEVVFEKEIAKAGIKAEFIYQNERYSSGVYAQGIRTALENRDKIAAVLNAFRKEPLENEWIPTTIFCEKCDRDEMDYERYLGEWSYSYKCTSCGHEATTDIRTTKNLKLFWRADWPMRWAYEGVDFEPGGKDHSSEGGSYDTCSRIVKEVWGKKAPIYLQYDFVSIKGGAGKMSSSSGELFTLSDAFKVYTPQMVRWIFAMQKPNHDFSLAFDEDVIKTYDEFDRAEAEVLGSPENQHSNTAFLRRAYELASVDGTLMPKAPFRPGFRVLCNRLQICDGNAERTLERFYKDLVKTAIDRELFMERAEKAWTWLSTYAPEEFRYRLHAKKVEVPGDDLQRQAAVALRQLVTAVDLDAVDPKDLNQKIYDDVIKASGCEAKSFFSFVYQKLIGRDQGPRLPGFLKEIGKTRLLELL